MSTTKNANAYAGQLVSQGSRVHRCTAEIASHGEPMKRAALCGLHVQQGQGLCAPVRRTVCMYKIIIIIIIYNTKV